MNIASPARHFVSPLADNVMCVRHWNCACGPGMPGRRSATQRDSSPLPGCHDRSRCITGVLSTAFSTAARQAGGLFHTCTRDTQTGRCAPQSGARDDGQHRPRCLARPAPSETRAWGSTRRSVIPTLQTRFPAMTMSRQRKRAPGMSHQHWRAYSAISLRIDP
jgi:hypothetical protein